MKQKILLFNYFVEKVVQQERKLLQTKDVQTLRLAVILANACIFKRCLSGVYQERIVIANPMFAEDLFVLLCLKAEKQGNHLLKAFDFKPKLQLTGDNSIKVLDDKELTSYLHNELYPKADSFNPCVCSELCVTLNQTNISPAFIRDASVENLPVADSCELTLMIDEAWCSMTEDADIMKCLSFAEKCNQHGVSTASTMYQQEMDFLLKRV